MGGWLCFQLDVELTAEQRARIEEDAYLALQADRTILVAGSTTEVASALLRELLRSEEA